MIIDVTYEKPDVLKLVEADLRKRGLRLREGTSLEYKGALQVKLSIEVEEGEDEEPAAPSQPERPALPPRAEASGGKIPGEESTAEQEEAEEPEPPAAREMDLSSILVASQGLGKTEGKFGKFALKKDTPPRQLGPGESLEYPKEEK